MDPVSLPSGVVCLITLVLFTPGVRCGEARTPGNVAVGTGTVATLVCASPKPTVVWSERITSASGKEISVDATIRYCLSSCTASQQQRMNRYQIQGGAEGSGIYNLQVGPLTAEDAGQYCCENYDLSVQDYTTCAEVIVLDNNVTCSGLPDTTRADTTANVTCSLRYAGRWAPEVTCEVAEDGGTASSQGDASTQGHVSVTWGVTPASGNPSVRIVCRSSFRLPDDVTGTEATNAPAMVTTWQQTMAVLYAPVEVEITPLQYRYDVGDVISCSANGNPPPLITWYLYSPWGKVSANATLVVTAGLGSGELRLRCLAQNTIRAQQHLSQSDVYFMINGVEDIADGDGGGDDGGGAGGGGGGDGGGGGGGGGDGGGGDGGGGGGAGGGGSGGAEGCACTESPSDDGYRSYFPWWIILLIVLCCLLFLILIIILIVCRCKARSGKQSTVGPAANRDKSHLVTKNGITGQAASGGRTGAQTTILVGEENQKKVQFFQYHQARRSHPPPYASNMWRGRHFLQPQDFSVENNARDNLHADYVDDLEYLYPPPQYEELDKTQKAETVNNAQAQEKSKPEKSGLKKTSKTKAAAKVAAADEINKSPGNDDVKKEKKVKPVKKIETTGKEK